MAIIAAAGSDPHELAQEFVAADLLTPSAFPHAVTRLQLHETQISWVILTGPYAYKIMKSVRFDFIDASTPARRREMCEEELRLNRRLAPDLYLDVVTITQEAAGPRVGGSGRILEYAVRMRQFDSSEELPALLERGAVTEQEVVDLAQRMAQFHQAAMAAPCDPLCPHTEHLRGAVLGTLATLLSHLECGAAPPELCSLIDWIHDYLQQRLPQLRTREQDGAIRECHGDLHARNVMRWNGRLVPFDCLEFDPKLRWIDVMNDVAFLVMDLSARGRNDLALYFLNSYLERTGDYDGVRHLSFYAAYRALVRAMVDSLEAETNPGRREEAHDRLRRRVTAAASHTRHARPALYLMHGPSGSGKSWLSERLTIPLGALRLRSDIERKRLAGGHEQELYAPAMNQRTYARLFDGARACLDGGRDVIVDAAFLQGSDRRPFQELAAGGGFPWLILDCDANPAVLARRIQERARQRTDPSDADTEVFARQVRARDPLSAEEQAHAVRVDTTEPEICRQALTRIQHRLASVH